MYSPYCLLLYRCPPFFKESTRNVLSPSDRAKISASTLLTLRDLKTVVKVESFKNVMTVNDSSTFYHFRTFYTVLMRTW